MIKNCSTCKHNPVDEHCKGCRGEKDGNTHWEPEPFINKPCISECVRHEEMTYEEAIEYNKNLRMYMKLSDKNQPCKFLEENYIALEMAIEALQQQSCEIYNTCTDAEIAESFIEDVEAVKDLLPQPKMGRWTGKWERRIVDSGYNADWKCSECGYKEMTDFPTKYCPSCGAKMESEEI